MLIKSQNNIPNSINKEKVVTNFRDILTEIGFSIPQGQKIRCKAYHRKDSKHANSLSIDFDSNSFYDFGASDDNIKSGSLQKLVALATGKGLDQFKLEYGERQYNNNEEVAERIELPKTYSNDCLKRLLPQYDFFIKRGISKKTLKIFEAGYATKETFAGRVVFPVRDSSDKIIGFNGRLVNWTKESPYPKWLLTKGAKSLFIYNQKIATPAILEKNEVILVESMGDCLALYECGIKNVIVLFGKEISRAIIKYVLSLNCNIVISTNKDGAENEFTGERAAEKIKDTLLPMFLEEKIKIKLPEGANDFGDMLKDLGKTSITNWYNEKNNLTLEEKNVEYMDIVDFL